MMDKKLILLYVLCLGFMTGCQKDDAGKSDPEVKSLKNEILISDVAGEDVMTVDWKYAEWELDLGEAGFLYDFQFLKGGSTEYASQTRVKFSFTENVTGEERKQVLLLKNITTGQNTEILVSQTPRAAYTVNIDNTKIYQKVTGFGGMLNPLNWTSAALDLDDVETLYSSEGLGFNMMRLMVYPDPNLWDTDIEAALKAQSFGARLLATPWTPPAYMKSNNSQSGGGHLLPEYYEAYANHLNNFVQHVRSRGVNLEAISIQNEPDYMVSYDGCEWTPDEMRNFIRDFSHLIDAKIIAAESFNYDQSYTDLLLNDFETVAKFGIVGTHLYGANVIKDYPLAREKGKEVWMTEHLMNDAAQNNGLGWEQALVFGKEVHDCMVNNFNAYIWWYLKRSYSFLGDGSLGTIESDILPRGYVLSHYAKYATNKNRINTTNLEVSDNVYITAYEGETDYTIVILNQGLEDIHYVQFVLPSPVSSAVAIESKDGSYVVEKLVALRGSDSLIVDTIGAKSIISIRVIK